MPTGGKTHSESPEDRNGAASEEAPQPGGKAELGLSALRAGPAGMAGSGSVEELKGDV